MKKDNKITAKEVKQNVYGRKPKVFSIKCLNRSI